MLWDRYSSPLLKKAHLDRLRGSNDFGPTWLPKNEEVVTALLFDAIDPSFPWSREHTIRLIADLQKCSPSTVYRRLDAVSCWLVPVSRDEYEWRAKFARMPIRDPGLVHHHINNMVAV